MQPLVSICIPTYNRAECLRKTIESIVYQPEFLSGEVEIVISDNASTDDTRVVCETYKGLQNFSYFRNEENVLDKNFPIVLSKASGVLRKLNNDTFVLENDALNKLCSIANKYREKKPYIYLSNQNGTSKEESFRDFVKDVTFGITWLPTFSIWGEECNQIIDDVEGCELRLWQVRKAYELAYKKNHIVVFNENIGKTDTPPKKDISYGLFQIFYCNYMSLLQPYILNGAIELEDKDNIEKDLLFNFFQGWLLNYELNSTDMVYSKEENFMKAVVNQYKNKPYWGKFKRSYKLSYYKRKAIFEIKRLLKKA